jgi:hypothetical protein
VSHVTFPLNTLARRDPAAAELLSLVYDNLRRLAAYGLGHDVPEQAPQPTPFGHEAFLCLPRGRPRKQRDRGVTAPVRRSATRPRTTSDVHPRR